jgi:hypothetical protein
MNWTQDQLEKFWKGGGAELVRGDWMAGQVRVSRGNICMWFVDPFELPLETLLDILERLARGQYLGIGCMAYPQPKQTLYKVQATDGNAKRVTIGKGAHFTRKLAAIDAICALIGLEMPEITDGQGNPQSPPSTRSPKGKPM